MVTEEALQEFEQMWLEDHPGKPLPSREVLFEQASLEMRAVEIVYYPRIPLEKKKLLDRFLSFPS